MVDQPAAGSLTEIEDVIEPAVSAVVGVGDIGAARCRRVEIPGQREHAFEGVVLMTEVCARLGIPVDIWTFGNKAQHLHSWETPISAETRATLGRVVQQCGGGTDMAGGIEAVTDALGELPHKDKVCFVLGDGEPNDERATRKAVRVLENQDCTVLGLGIGNSTENLGRFFNDGLYNVPVERIATSLARMLRKYFLN